MEEHPVPQNVTSFEFHLVGDMTLKQFGYLATGLSIAYLTFIFVFSFSPFLAIPIIALSATAGAAFAFLPILDRPLDHWAKSFFKAVYSPTQGKWRPQALLRSKEVVPEPVIKNRLQIYLSSIGVNPLPDIPSFSTLPPTSLPALQTPPVPIKPKPEASSFQLEKEKAAPASNLPSSKELNDLVSMAKQVQVLQSQISETEKQIVELKTAATEHASSVSPDQIRQVASNLQNLIKQSESISQKTVSAKKPSLLVTKPQIKVVTLSHPTPTQPLLTSFPNVINGIVTDVTGNYLEGVIVIIHNKDGIPVRALKTNKLGQFTGATPLPLGTYTITLEKENLDFETLQVTLNNAVLAPILITSKRGGPREY